MFFIMSTPACIISGDMLLIMSRPLPMSIPFIISAMFEPPGITGTPAEPPSVLTSSMVDSLLLPAGAEGGTPGPVPATFICCAMRAIDFIVLGSIPAIICGIIGRRSGFHGMVMHAWPELLLWSSCCCGACDIILI